MVFHLGNQGLNCVFIQGQPVERIQGFGADSKAGRLEVGKNFLKRQAGT